MLTLKRAGAVALLTSLACAAAYSQTVRPRGAKGDIVVTVAGLRNTNGVVRWALYSSEAAFSNAVNGRGDSPVRSGKAPPQIGTCRFVVNGLEHGDYGLLLFHDENGNRKMDKRALRLPKERVGISNYRSLPLRRPVWRRARFTHNQARTPVTITTVR